MDNKKKQHTSMPYATVLTPATSLNNKTGSWRTLTPEYIHKLPPCNVTCPAGENIQSWLSYAQEGNIRKAWEVMIEDNPFPAIMGRVCYHTCEKVCNRTHFDGAVKINLIEKSIGDIAIKNNWSFENNIKNTGKKVLIIGAGPSGLAASYFLRKKGHDITVYEMHSKAGGMMRYGVPSYRLSRNIIDAEVKRITDLGVKILYNKYIRDISEVIQQFDAVYISIGSFLAAKRCVEIKNNAKVMDAVEFLRILEDCPKDVPDIGKNVLIYGGGNTAIDAARTALRLGAENVKIIYRRTINKMPAHDVEIQEALNEGIEILCMRSIEIIDGKKVLINKMIYDEAKDVLSVSGESEVLEADFVVFAIGQDVDTSICNRLDKIIVSEKGVIEVDSHMMTGVKGIFAGGDAVPGKRTVTHAIGHGKKAAKYIDAYLRGEEIIEPKKHDVATFKGINTAYFKKNPRIDSPKIVDISFRETGFSLDEKEVISESERCFSCGNCFHCDNCYGYCPDNAIIKHPDGSLEFNYEYCKGCGICASECPCGAIKMVSKK